MSNVAHAEDRVPRAVEPRNEPVKNYLPGSPERSEIRSVLRKLAGERADMPLVIGGKKVRTGRLEAATVPHAHRCVIGQAHLAGKAEIADAIVAANIARQEWSRWSYTARASVFLKAADLLSTRWRYILNAATMLGQSKTVHQAEIDSAAELIDFWRFNVSFMERICAEQPLSPQGSSNRLDYRPLEGFILAITPFNFTAIAGNLPTAPALMGNTVLWKPSATAKLAAHYIMEILSEAGLPDGVINLVYGDADEVSQLAIADTAFAGLHFTGSTAVFNGLIQRIAQQSGRYRTYPRVVGETGGKNFVVAHPSADVPALVAAIIRGGYEYQGQKCSAASRVFVPDSMWKKVGDWLCDEIATISVGDVAEFRNFMGAVIDERSWLKQRRAVEAVRHSGSARILAGGDMDKSDGYFVQPTLIEVNDPWCEFMTEEYFGPLVSIMRYPDHLFGDVLQTIDDTSRYGLTGAIFATDRAAIEEAAITLRNCAGNFYINDKPTGAVVGQQPFGGGRASGTNDKAGSTWNLIRWTSPRAIKENFDAPKDYRYPFMVDG